MIIVIAILTIIIFALIIVISMYYVVNSKKIEDERIKYNNQLYGILESCNNECGNECLSKRICDIIDILRYGDVNSPDAARKVEKMILEKSLELYSNITNKKMVNANSNLDELEKLINDRTTITKYDK